MMSRQTHQVLVNSPSGLYCPQGDFYIDPTRPVAKAIISHGHSDHARPGMAHYWCSRNSEPLLRHRLGLDINLTSLAYGESVKLNDARVSLHAAGHIRGSAQIRVEVNNEVWVVSGDYKRCYDPTTEPFEVVPCDVFITEATFANPIYRWQPGADTAREVFHWWANNREQNVTSILFCYALGKVQRLLAELNNFTDQPVYAHGAVLPLYDIYRQQGVNMLPVLSTANLPKDHDYGKALVVAPPSAHRSTWMKRFRQVSTGFASGWMQVRGARRRKGYHRGFVMSDHADWPSLLKTIQETGCKRVYATHGDHETLARFLNESGTSAASLSALPYIKTDKAP